MAVGLIFQSVANILSVILSGFSVVSGCTEKQSWGCDFWHVESCGCCDMPSDCGHELRANDRRFLTLMESLVSDNKLLDKSCWWRYGKGPFYWEVLIWIDSTLTAYVCFGLKCTWLNVLWFKTYCHNSQMNIRSVFEWYSIFQKVVFCPLLASYNGGWLDRRISFLLLRLMYFDGFCLLVYALDFLSAKSRVWAALLWRKKMFHLNIYCL